jgi:hypothetical protein
VGTKVNLPEGDDQRASYVEETSRSLGSGGVRMQSKLARPKKILVDSIRKKLDCARTAVSGIQNNLKEMSIGKLILTREHHEPSQCSSMEGEA